jgi:hypothetical protein
VQGFPTFCLHDKLPWGESRVKVLISAKAGCSRLFSAFLLSISLTISSVQGRLSGPMHSKAPCDACPLAALLEVVLVVLAVPPGACPVAALLEVVRVALAVAPDACPVAALLEVVFVVLTVAPDACPVAAVPEVAFVVGLTFGCVEVVCVVCPISIKPVAIHTISVNIVIRFMSPPLYNCFLPTAENTSCPSPGLHRRGEIKEPSVERAEYDTT